jgi:predicted dehydrogenase
MACTWLEGEIMRVGVVGYGSGGQNFHTPFIDAADDVELVGVVTRSPRRQAAVSRDWPGVPTFDSLTDLLAAGVDAVTISTPPATRRELVQEAVAAGVHVIADKPFAPTASAALELEKAAAAAGVMLSVYHNRRWDADILTLRSVVATGRLGELWRVHSRFDLDDPATLEAGPYGGLLRDIGSHVVDQMLWLLGPVTAVTARLDWVDLPEGRTDAGFFISLRHASGVQSYVESTKINRVAVRELRAYGSDGSYRFQGTDVQAQSIFSGRRPAAERETWGFEPEDHWGVLATAAGEERVPSEQGRYHDLYTQFAAAARGDAPQPVPAAEGIRTLAVLDAARDSDRRGCTVELAPIG